MSGGTIGAEEASLAIMVGGEQEVFDKVVDVLKVMGNPTLSWSTIKWSSFQTS